MRRAWEWLKHNKGPTVVIVIILWLLYANFWPEKSRHISDFGNSPGTIEHPAGLRNFGGDGLREERGRDRFWRTTRIRYVYEAPLAPGHTSGRCLIELGYVSDGWARDDDNATPALNILYTSNGIVLETGDASDACNEQAINASLRRPDYPSGDTLPLSEAATVGSGGESTRDFIHVTYLVGDVEPDAVAVTPSAVVAGDHAPKNDIAVWAFQLSNPDSGFDQGAKWNALFGLTRGEDATTTGVE